MKRKLLFLIFMIIIVLLAFIGLKIFAYQTTNIFGKTGYIIVYLVVVIVVIFTFIKIFKEKEIVINKKYDKVNEVDFFVNEIDKIIGYKKIIKAENGLILINQAGVFEIRFIYHNGTLKGDLNIDKWQINHGIINNPFILKSDAYNYLVLTKNLVCEVTNIRLITKTKLVFVLDNLSKNKKYNEQEINELYEKIRSMYGSNEN